MEECLEALHENISANLPAHCTLAPECLAQSNSARASASVSDTNTESDPAGLASLALSAEQDTHKASSCQNQASVPAAEAAQVPAASAAALPESAQVAARLNTQVLVAELDWMYDAALLRPPFEVVLVADVVRFQ